MLTAASFRNAIVALAALGGSTNAVVHLLAIAGRLGIPLTLDDFDRIGSDVPLLVNLQPAGQFLMEDLHRAGGLLAVLREVRDLLDPSALTMTGKPLTSYLDDAQIWDREVIAVRDEPVQDAAGHRGAARQPGPQRGGRSSRRPRPRTCCSTAAGPWCSTRIEDLHTRLDDQDLDVDADSVLVLRGCGPKGYPGMPEVSNMPMPAKLVREGVRDMVRICDGRMSGTAYGTVVLHVSPEAAAGGPLSKIRTGDWIVLDVPGRRVDVELRDGRTAGAAAWRRPWRTRWPSRGRRLGAAVRRQRPGRRGRGRPGLPAWCQRARGRAGVPLRSPTVPRS